MAETAKVYSVAEAARAAIDSYGLRPGAKRPKLIPLGIRALDQVLGGMSPGQSVGIAATTGVGKSSVVLACCQGISAAGYKPGYLSLEDPLDFVGARALAMSSGVNSLDMRRGILTVEERDRVAASIKKLEDMKLDLFVDMGADIERGLLAFRALAKRECDVIFVDYLQKMRTGRYDRRVEMGLALSALQTAAQEFGIPVVFVSQVRRMENPDKWPTIYDLKESGDIENEMRTIILLRKTKDGHVEGKLAKSSVGGEGTSWVYERDRSGTLVELDRREHDLEEM